MEKTRLQFVICSKCGGQGKNCPECSNLGIGAFYQSRFLYWGRKINKTLIELGKLERLFKKIFNFIILSIGLIGIISLVFWFLEFSDTTYLKTLMFWQEKHWLILIFWISLLFDFLIIYRITEEEVSKEKIKKKAFKVQTRSEELPNNWNELKKRRNNLDVSDGYGRDIIKIIENAYLQALENNAGKLDLKYFFLEMLKEKKIIIMFARLNVDVAPIEEKLKKQLERSSNEKELVISNELKEVLITSYLEAYQEGQKRVDILNIILPLIEKDENIAEILYDSEIDKNKIKNVVAWFRINQKMVDGYERYKRMSRFKPSSSMDRAYTAVATPVLNHFSHDLTLAAKFGRLDYCVAREQEIDEIFETLESGQAGIVLTGESGVGKRTLIYGIAERMVEENVPKIFKDKRLIELDVARLVSGVSPSQAQQRMLVIIDEIARAGNILLFIEDLENLAGISSGGEESLELSEVLSNAVDRKALICFATATENNYVKYLENTALGKAMTRIEVEEPVNDQAIQILQSKVGIWEAKYKINFTYNAISQAVKLSSEYMHDKYLPEKAIKILESTAIQVSKRCEAKTGSCLAGKDDVANVVSDVTKIPVSKVTEDEGQKLLNLENKIHERMVNQVEAVKMVSNSLRRARTNLRENKRPIASFLFMGPTGVGKTELAKAVAEVYFGKEDYMIRVDMSEYQNSDSINKMIGDETGNLGYLTEAVRKQPFSLILLDEFEKAHGDIMNLFLQVMDDGRLTDGQGRTIDFTNSIIIATSNAGALFIQDQIKAGRPVSEIKQTLINDHLNKIMRPELINRFDGIIVFKPLSEDNVIEITKLMLKGMKNMLEEKGINLKTYNEGIKKLAHEGYDPQFGARPLRRLLQDKVENIIANKILAGEIKRRDTVVINPEGEIEVEKGKVL